MPTRDTPKAPNPWDDASPTPAADPRTLAEMKRPQKAQAPDLSYDLKGLMNDFPTAKELERFVYDETGIVLNLKGRANRLKYQVALEALNGQEVDAKFIGADNPYVDKADLVPVDRIRDVPPSDPSIPPRSELQNSFHSRMIPHPDENLRAQGRFCEVTFRKYNDGLITYEVLGPIDERPVGEKIDKFGRTRPELITWVDPRTGEQVAQRPDGTLTPQGKRLRALMKTSQRFRVNRSNQWDIWVDRDFLRNTESVIRNPWGT